MSHRWIWLCGMLAMIAILYSPAPAASTHAAGPSQYVSDEVLVKLNPLVDVRAFAAANGLNAAPDAIDQLGSRPIYRLQITDSTPPSNKVMALVNDLRVIFAEPNQEGQTPEARQRSSWAVGGAADGYSAQWAANKIRLQQAHTVSRGAGISVAVLDTGVELAHPALAGRLQAGFDFVDLDADPSEEGVYGQDAAYGHGTHVAGLVALAAPDARIMPLRTLRPDGTGTIWAQAKALNYAATHGADVINMSFSYGDDSPLIDEILAEVTCASIITPGCLTSVTPGAIVVAAAGNSGARVREYPAADIVPGVVGVAASTEDDTLAAFSTYGSWIELAAPGERILSSVPDDGYATWSGTSMATPLVAGTAALVRAAYPQLRPVPVAQRMITTAATIGGAVRRRLDAAAPLGLPAPNRSGTR